MSHHETLESRRYFATAGLDHAFGDAGTLMLPDGVSTDGTALAVSGAIWIDAVAGRRHFLYKFSDAGTLDTTWGNGGRVTFGVIDVARLAYDGRRDAVYAAGIDNAGKTLRVARFDAAGRTDTSFGDAGVFSYTATAETSQYLEIKFTVRLGVDQLTPLPHGKLLVTYSRTTRRIDETSDILWATDRDELAVMRLGSSGQRDRSFGTSGHRTVLQGLSSVELHGVRSYTNIPVLGEIVPRVDGGYHVVAAQPNSWTTGTPGNVVRTMRSYVVHSQTLTNLGEIDPSASDAWTLVGGEPDGKPRDMHVKGVFADGERGAFVVAHITGVSRDRGYERYVLTPGNRPASRELLLSDKASLVSVLHAPTNDFFAITQAGSPKAWRATCFTSAFTARRSFAERAIARIDAADPTFVVDADRRLVVMEGNAVQRFA